MTGYVLYMDILAFTSKIKSDVFREKFEGIINYIGNKFRSDSKATIYIVSDSIIVTSQELRAVLNYSRMFYTWSMRNNFWVRGAIAHGDMEIIDPTTIVRENRNIILSYLGGAYLTAYNIERETNMAGIIIDERVSSDNPDMPLLEDDDYINYREYLPKEGNGGKKRVLLPTDINEELYIATSLHFREMLVYHSEDIDKCVNTFCFYVKLLMMRSDIRNVYSFLDRLIEEVNTYSNCLLIPQKLLILFIAVFDGIFSRNANPREGDDKQQLKPYIPKLLGALKTHGYLSSFLDYILEYDKRRKTTLYKNIHENLFKKEQQ